MASVSCSVFGNYRTPNTDRRSVSVSWTGYVPLTGHYELDLVELGKRVANAYDERHSVIYRLGEAAGYARADVLNWLPEHHWRNSRVR
jgi:hypothetical protein